MEVTVYSFYFPFPNATSQAPHARTRARAARARARARDMHLLRMSKSMLIACAQRRATIRATRARASNALAYGVLGACSSHACDVNLKSDIKPAT